jgi:hypothetical protein
MMHEVNDEGLEFSDKTSQFYLDCQLFIDSRAKKCAHWIIDNPVLSYWLRSLVNYDALKKELIARGYTFKSDTDTEVLVNFIEEIQKEEQIVNFQPVNSVNQNLPVPQNNDSETISGGVTFMDDSFVGAQPEKNIFNSDSSFKVKEIDSIQNIVTKNIPEEKIEQSIKNPENNVSTNDLEADFSQTFSVPISTPIALAGDDPILLEEEKLKRLHKELKDKANSKKIVVKERLEKLKLEKESLGRELNDIKELEEISQKIEEKLKSLESLDNEIDSLEKQAHEELQ